MSALIAIAGALLTNPSPKPSPVAIERNFDPLAPKE